MKKGILERLLTLRFGEPLLLTKSRLTEAWWAKQDDPFASVLYLPQSPESKGLVKPELESIYGGAVGGFLIGNSLKLSMLTPHDVFGLYNIGELLVQEEVKRAASIDPSVSFFMDAANVWYYGVKDKNLCVFDAETDELDILGPIEIALGSLLDEWLQVSRSV